MVGFIFMVDEFRPENGCHSLFAVHILEQRRRVIQIAAISMDERLIGDLSKLTDQQARESEQPFRDTAQGRQVSVLASQSTSNSR